MSSPKNESCGTTCEKTLSCLARIRSDEETYDSINSLYEQVVSNLSTLKLPLKRRISNISTEDKKKVILRNKNIDVSKYRKIVNLLFKKPKIIHCVITHGEKEWNAYRVKLSKKFSICYHIDYEGIPDTIHYIFYTYRYNNFNFCCCPENHLDII